MVNVERLLAGILGKQKASVKAACPYDRIASATLLIFFFCWIFIFSTIEAVVAAEITADDVEISGEVIRSSGSTVTIRLDIGRVVMVASGDISAIRLEMQDGQSVQGLLDRWKDGVYVIKSGDELIHAKDGVILKVENSNVVDEPVEPIAVIPDEVVEQDEARSNRDEARSNGVEDRNNQIVVTPIPSLLEPKPTDNRLPNGKRDITM